MRNWTLPGPQGRLIVGSTHPACGEASRGHVLIAHGFKGYKDYGFFPWLAEHLSQTGVDVHRFNFSCSGMDHGSGPFDESAFEQDTWNRQVEDLLWLLESLQNGTVADGGPVMLVGHSRGGVASLLASGRHAGSDALAQLRRVVTLAAPSSCLSMEASLQEQLLSEGMLPSPSSRTGQVLQIGSGFLQEQLDDPEAHDLLGQVGSIMVPLTLVHGTEDASVDVSAVDEISAAATAPCRTHRIEGANHVFNTPNPSAMDHAPSEALSQIAAVLDEVASGLSGE